MILDSLNLNFVFKVDCTKDDPACPGMDCSFTIVQNLCPNYCHIAACPATTTAQTATTSKFL